MSFSGGGSDAFLGALESSGRSQVLIAGIETHVCVYQTAVDLIDFEYGPQNEYWHTEEDTMDKLDARSFQVVGDVVLRVIGLLEERE